MSSPDDKYFICDRQFWDDLNQLKALRSYMIRQAKSIEAGTLELGDLNLLHFREPEKGGRWPTHDEWSNLEHRIDELYRNLTEVDRRRFLYSQIPSSVQQTAKLLGIIALASLFVAFAASLITIGPSITAATVGQETTPDKIAALQERAATAGTYYSLIMLTSFLVWAAALGGIGSIAFIGMNALAVQEDATFDITNTKLIGLRVLLGALFATVLTLPFGFGSFSHFVREIDHATEPTAGLAIKSISYCYRSSWDSARRW
jgi:hypothetical protein